MHTLIPRTRVTLYREYRGHPHKQLHIAPYKLFTQESNTESLRGRHHGNRSATEAVK